ncbi:MAG TPA: hypothetical protein G4O01_05195 [Dehalococcoidia bacterium]|nr:hypothetical protein [Dehalococcoidia bacterium]
MEEEKVTKRALPGESQCKWCWCPSHAQLDAKLGKWHPA